MAATAQRTRPPQEALRALVERFDSTAMDVPGGSARVRLEVLGQGSWDAAIRGRRVTLKPASGAQADARLVADAATWRRIAQDLRAGMDAFRRGRLTVRHNLHLGVGFLAATSGNAGAERLEFSTLRTSMGPMSALAAGQGEPLLCLHGLGATKASFLPTVSELATQGFRVTAVDFPGFGDSTKPIGAAYNAGYFARSAIAALDALGLERAHLAGNSMGGRVAIEAGFQYPDRIGRLVLLSPALAWLRDRRWTPLVRALRPELGLVQIAPSRVVEGVVRRLVPGAMDGWTAAGVDEFLRAYLNPRGRAAFYAAARSIYLDEPQGEKGFWARLETLAPESLFVWGRQDTLVPIAFMSHVERALPSARHLELDCGHVPQLERPREVHRAMAKFLLA